MRIAPTSVVLLALLIACNPASSQDKPPELVASTDPRSPEDEKRAFRLPPGFEAQLIAAEPDVHKPMNLAFDDRGRLWVTSSLEYPFPAKPGTTPRDAVVILDDFGPDGRARKITRFVEGLNIPIGVLPLTPDSALVHSIPKVERFTDTDGDGRADKREDAYATYGFRDTHGMTNAFTLGFDGWIYACHGFANESTVKGKDGQPITLQSGNTYRMWPDGSHLEWWSHGQVNPFGIALDPLGNMFTSDCHTRPIFQILRGAFYDSFGKPHDGLGYGPEMMSHDHGSTGIAGIVYYAADHFPKEWRDTIFVGNVVTSRINHDTLERHGSTLKAVAQPDFLASDDPWFRPVDLKLGPDGALYVADFYNRIIGHYEVPLTHPGRDRERGRIWRIIYRGADGRGAPPKMHRADWTKATVEELVEDLGHPNLSVRLRATNLLAARPPTEVARALEAGDPSARRTSRMHELWVLERLGQLGDIGLAKALRSADPGVRTHAMRIASERPHLNDSVGRLVLEGLRDDDAFVRRASADALGRHPSAENLEPLLALRHEVPADDTHLLHVVRMALRDQLLQTSVWDFVKTNEWNEADARALADVSLGVPGREAAVFLLKHLEKHDEPAEIRVRMIRHVARYGEDSAGLLAVIQKDRPAELPRQAAQLKAVHQGLQERGAALDEATRGHAENVARSLIGSADDAAVLAGIDLAATVRSVAARDDLLKLAERRDAPEPRRLAAFRALATINPAATTLILGEVLADSSEPITLREQSATLLAEANRPESRKQLIEVLPTAPARLQTAIALGLAATRPGAEALLTAVESGKASARLLRERPVEARIRSAGVAETRLATLLAGVPADDSRLLDLLNRRRASFNAAKADASRGAEVFQKQCAACHQIGGQGTKIGPQLDGIGTRGADRLMEDILDPSRNVDQAFRSTTIALDTGQVVSGLLLKEEGEVLVLADAEGKEVRVPKSGVEERKLSPLSPMPSKFGDLIAEDEFHHLIAFLLSKRETK